MKSNSLLFLDKNENNNQFHEVHNVFHEVHNVSHEAHNVFHEVHNIHLKNLEEIEKNMQLLTDPNAEKNRQGILLGNTSTTNSTKTITPTLWSLYNKLPAHTFQKPHRHNSVAIDYCIYANKNVYTLIGDTINEDGTIKNPKRVDWKTKSVFTTPPGLWHSHHNDGDTDAYVLPLQDAGLYTYQRTLDIQFVE